MAGRSRPSIEKRLREQARQQRQREKEQRRAERRRERDSRPGDPQNGTGVDPDLEGIVPGPQEQPWMNDDDS
ncbi:MAG TPA: hypothetical protein VKB80_19340 [Kofleriaceae bacterium]|nr:hypothetical protein [Kofleriaceae bacterium]